MTFHENMIVEIKCPSAEPHQSALNGVVTACFADQCQQQFLVTGLPNIHYYSFDGENGVFLDVVRDNTRIVGIIEETTAFWEHVMARTWSTDEWTAAAAEWIMATHAVEHAEEMEKQARSILVSMLLGDQPKREGSGVSVARVTRKGAMDYDALLKAKGVAVADADLEFYRKGSSESIKVSVLKEAKAPAALAALAPSKVATPPASPAPAKPVVTAAAPADEGFILTV
ncbi:hypothetical protein KTQ42_20245 [Noviherbaspirillum sp. L7-7A]|uniref:hypothetical protein n=1 Tax=Noviherbaspirillum sp. L7-7A TaxID=2850560 RepID=UPI001C2BA9E3|nr:hypothetical protein [Noviherbaspirillum sp. L7-7A]MBV0881615.1 hypothetical protein [Noviherbaspirillum sp. L7-7A]